MLPSVCGEDEVGSANIEGNENQSRLFKAVKRRVCTNAKSPESIVLRFVQSLAADNITPRSSPGMLLKVSIYDSFSSDSGPVRIHVQIRRNPGASPQTRTSSKPAYTRQSDVDKQLPRHKSSVTRHGQLTSPLGTSRSGSWMPCA